MKRLDTTKKSKQRFNKRMNESNCFSWLANSHLRSFQHLPFVQSFHCVYAIIGLHPNHSDLEKVTYEKQKDSRVNAFEKDHFGQTTLLIPLRKLLCRSDLADRSPLVSVEVPLFS